MIPLRPQGPDPVWALGAFGGGVLGMGLGGAANSHLLFLCGATLMLGGAAAVVGSLALAALRRVSLPERARRILAGRPRL